MRASVNNHATICPNNFYQLFTQSHNPICIEHFLTNYKALFKFSKTFETVLSVHHKLISTVMISRSFKEPPRKARNHEKIKKTEKNFNKYENHVNWGQV